MCAVARAAELRALQPQPGWIAGVSMRCDALARKVLENCTSVSPPPPTARRRLQRASSPLSPHSTRCLSPDNIAVLVVQSPKTITFYCVFIMSNLSFVHHVSVVGDWWNSDIPSVWSFSFWYVSNCVLWFLIES